MSNKVEKDFAVGDVVKLRSGGGNMVVEALTAPNGDQVEKLADDSKVRTVWQDEAGQLHTSHGLSPALLESVTKVDRGTSNDGDGSQDGKDGVGGALTRQDASQGAASGGVQTGGKSHVDWLADRSVPGQGNAANNSPSQLNRPQSAFEQSRNQEKVHEGDDHPQSLGNEAERQPAQEPEIAHAKMTDDPQSGVGTVHEPGKDYSPDKGLKDPR